MCVCVFLFFFTGMLSCLGTVRQCANGKDVPARVSPSFTEPTLALCPVAGGEKIAPGFKMEDVSL